MTESHDPAAALAERLFTEHAEGRPFRRLQGTDRPASLDEGYRVQHLLNRRFAEAGRGAPAGYKVGLTSEAIQTMYGSDQPISGVVFATAVHRSPARIALADYTHLGIEFEPCRGGWRSLPARGCTVHPSTLPQPELRPACRPSS